MSYLLGYLPVLACPVGMGLMMWMMMRSSNSHQQSPQPASQSTPHVSMTPEQQSELRRLRAELDDIRSTDGRHGDLAR